MSPDVPLNILCKFSAFNNYNDIVLVCLFYNEVALNCTVSNLLICFYIVVLFSGIDFTNTHSAMLSILNVLHVLSVTLCNYLLCTTINVFTK